MKYGILLTVLVLTAGAFAQQQQTARDAFLRNQAFAEMQRVLSQLEILQSNFEELQRRVAQLERNSSNQNLQNEIAALKATDADLKRDLAAQRSEIVKDLSARLAQLQPKTQPQQTASKPREVVIKGPTSTYTVKSGDTLSLIAEAFRTTVSKLKEMNALKNDNLRVGQKIIVPQVKD